MSVPVKYREIGDFHEYYSGARTAPFLTIFVGGNHEASNYLFELYYGGWVAPNIYYMGAANIIRCGPLRIAGLSGIWKGYNYQKSHHERLPYNQDDVKSIYHVREVDVRKLMQVRTQVDVGISHDWPRGVEWSGNHKALFSMKSHFEEDARNGTLGSVAARYVMDRLRPRYWFSAHLHCRFSAVINYDTFGPIPTLPLHEREPASLISLSLEEAKKKLLSSIGVQGEEDSTTPENAADAVNADEIDLDTEETFTGPKVPIGNTDEIDLDLDDADAALKPVPGEAVETEPSMDDMKAVAEDDERDVAPPATLEGPSKLEPQAASVVPEDVLNQLPDSFKQPKRKRSESPMPIPEAITNKTTMFLALDKCLPRRKFLELCEIEPHDGSENTPQDTPFELCYDEEWLAITRVFAPSQIFGDSQAHPKEDQGQKHYLSRIKAEEQWVQQNIVARGKMAVPRNFEQTAPVYDEDVDILTQQQPAEYTNNQTSTFCNMLQIPNPFNISDEERQARVKSGPAPSSQRPQRGGRGGLGGGRGRGGGRGFGRGRGHGRGRGR
jgi:lariat debranching enzyme